MKKITPEHPIMMSARLLLRPFSLNDVTEVSHLVGEREVAEPLMAVRYPYSENDALRWVNNHKPSYEANGSLNFAVELCENKTLVGFIGMGGNDGQAGIGYWYGKAFWGNGYATEAGCAVLAFGFEELDLQSVEASHLSKNEASGRVLRKIGMVITGQRPHYYHKWSKYCQKDEYAITESEYVKAYARSYVNYSYRRLPFSQS